MHFQPHEVPVFWWSWGRGEGRGGKAPNLVPRSYRVIGLGRSEFETRRLPRYKKRLKFLSANFYHFVCVNHHGDYERQMQIF